MKNIARLRCFFNYQNRPRLRYHNKKNKGGNVTLDECFSQIANLAKLGYNFSVRPTLYRGAIRAPYEHHKLCPILALLHNATGQIYIGSLTFPFIASRIGFTPWQVDLFTYAADWRTHPLRYLLLQALDITDPYFIDYRASR